MGEVLIAGMAAMLICIFLGPKFIEYLRVKEFGQHIREDGPQEHHTKAGTPTMGGLIVFASICVPFLVLSDRDAQSMAVFGVAMGCATLGFADDFTKIVKRRSLGLSARSKLLVQLLMAPLHHHFEMMAWSETKIMLRFWIIAAACSGIGFSIYQQSIGG